MSATSRCWIMWNEAICSPSTSSGETSATKRQSRPPRPRGGAPAAGGARRRPRARERAPAQPVDDARSRSGRSGRRARSSTKCRETRHRIVTGRVLFRRTPRGRLRGVPLVDLLAPPLCAACRRPAHGRICGECLRGAAVAARPPLPALRAAAPSLGLPGRGGGVRPRVGAARLRGHGARARPRAEVPRRAAGRGADGGAHGREPAGRPAGAAAGPRPGLRPPRPPRRGFALVPVPPHRGRLRRRGFDPAALLAAGLAERAGLPLSACLRRADRGRRQVGAGRVQRRSAGRFAAVATAAPPRAAVLVDDVHTTGATLDACARALKERGAEWVGAATYVRTL